ncbi:hypothetical protein [Noviherbaspirillum pedocola]|uniref:Uncharacterized protein n=1 Tax=Noviherbaspirillum pedocola TaxID=2801341 RepID=A0A934SW78_9BURK|nr:hypothetical protein [Noviherbaspirillum pedocola]MBK4736897.1 hypothetical protein [Noviherbaspirillum pedocola]
MMRFAGGAALVRLVRGQLNESTHSMQNRQETLPAGSALIASVVLAGLFD